MSLLLFSHDVTTVTLSRFHYAYLMLNSCHAHSCTHYNCHMHCLISIEPHRSAMWSFAQPIDLPLVMVACLPLTFSIAPSNTLTGLVHIISFAYDSLDSSMCISYRSCLRWLMPSIHCYVVSHGVVCLWCHLGPFSYESHGVHSIMSLVPHWAMVHVFLMLYSIHMYSCHLGPLFIE